MFGFDEPQRQQQPIVVPSRDRLTNTERVAELETETAIERLRRLEEWLDLERQRQAPNRYQQALDDDFFDGLQWSDEDAQALIARGQAPLVYNKVAPTIRWVTGTEKRTRIDWKVYPRSDDDAAGADAKTKLLKYIQDVNKSAFARSAAFTDAMKVGVGWLECGIRADPTEFIVFDAHESWRNVWYDSLAEDSMQRDWRYMIRKKSVDTDIAETLFPWRREAIRASSTYNDQIGDDRDDEWYLGSLLRSNDPRSLVVAEGGLYLGGVTEQFNKRSRIQLYEMWYRYPTRMYLVWGGQFHGKQFDPQNPIMAQMLREGAISLFDRVALKMRCAVFMRGTLLQDVPSPYRHDRFPFTPVWGNRRARDRMAYGMVRNLRDPQEDFNKRMSKALFALSTRRIEAEKGAVDDWEELRLEAARPDAILIRNPGKQLQMTTDVDVAQHHIQYAEIDSRMIQDASGVTDENMGRRTNATSGYAIERRQEQGAAVTADYFDNLRLAIQLHGEKVLSLVEQYVTMPMQIRILGERQGYDFTPINWAKRGADGQPIILNDITASQADFVVSQQDFRESAREAAFETLMEMLGKIAQLDPSFVKMLLDDVLEMSNIPGKDDIVATIRDITGKVARDKRLTPEEQQVQKQREEAKAQEAAAAKALQLRGITAEIAAKEAQAKKLEAEAVAAIKEAESAGGTEAAVAEVAAGYQKQLDALRQDTAKLIDALREQVRAANAKAADSSAKIASDERIAERKIESEERIAGQRIVSDEAIAREKARKDADAKAAAATAAIGAKQEQSSRAAQVGKQIDALGAQFDRFRADVQAQMRELRVEQREGLATFVEKQSAGRAEVAPAQPSAPVVVVVPTEDGEVEKRITIETDANGNPKAATVTETRKAPRKKDK